MVTSEEMDSENSSDNERRPSGESLAVINSAWPEVSTKWMLMFSFAVHIGLGWLFYCFAPENRLSEIYRYFKSITIGYSLRLAPRVHITS